MRARWDLELGQLAGQRIHRLLCGSHGSGGDAPGCRSRARGGRVEAQRRERRAASVRLCPSRGEFLLRLPPFGFAGAQQGFRGGQILRGMSATQRGSLGLADSRTRRRPRLRQFLSQRLGVAGALARLHPGKGALRGIRGGGE